MDKQDIQNYINNFRRFFSGFLKPDISMQSTVYPYDKGAILVLELNANSLNKDEIRANSIDINDALKRTNLFENEKREHFHNFIGTNILLIKNKIIIIKDSNLREWTTTKVEEDIQKITNPSKQ